MFLSDRLKRKRPEDCVDGHEHGLSKNPGHGYIAILDLIAVHVDVPGASRETAPSSFYRRSGTLWRWSEHEDYHYVVSSNEPVREIVRIQAQDMEDVPSTYHALSNPE